MAYPGPGIPSSRTTLLQLGNQIGPSKLAYTQDDAVAVQGGIHNMFMGMLKHAAGDEGVTVNVPTLGSKQPQFSTLTTRQLMNANKMTDLGHVFDHIVLHGVTSLLELLGQIDGEWEGEGVRWFRTEFEPQMLQHSSELAPYNGLRASHSAMAAYFREWNRGVDFSSKALQTDSGRLLVSEQFRELAKTVEDHRHLTTLNAVIEGHQMYLMKYMSNGTLPHKSLKEAIRDSVARFDIMRKEDNALYLLATAMQEQVSSRNGDILDTALIAPEQGMYFNSMTSKVAHLVGGATGVARAEDANSTYLQSLPRSGMPPLLVLTLKVRMQALQIFTRANSQVSITGECYSFPPINKQKRRVHFYDASSDADDGVEWKDALKNCMLFDMDPDSEHHGLIVPPDRWMNDRIKEQVFKKGGHFPFYHRAIDYNGTASDRLHRAADPQFPEPSAKRFKKNYHDDVVDAIAALERNTFIGQMKLNKDFSDDDLSRSIATWCSSLPEQQLAEARGHSITLKGLYDEAQQIEFGADDLAYLQSFDTPANATKLKGQGINSAIYDREEILSGPRKTKPLFNLPQPTLSSPPTPAELAARVAYLSGLPSVPFTHTDFAGLEELCAVGNDSIAYEKWGTWIDRLRPAVQGFKNFIESYILAAFPDSPLCSKHSASMIELRQNVEAIIFNNTILPGIVPLFVVNIPSVPAATSGGQPTPGAVPAANANPDTAKLTLLAQLNQNLAKGLNNTPKLNKADALKDDTTKITQANAGVDFNDGSFIESYKRALKDILAKWLHYDPSAAGSSSTTTKSVFDLAAIDLAVDTHTTGLTDFTGNPEFAAAKTQIIDALSAIHPLTLNNPQNALLNNLPRQLHTDFDAYKNGLRVLDATAQTGHDKAQQIFSGTGYAVRYSTLTLPPKLAEKLMYYTFENKGDGNPLLISQGPGVRGLTAAARGPFFLPAHPLNHSIPVTHGQVNVLGHVQSGGLKFAEDEHGSWINRAAYTVRAHHAMMGGIVPLQRAPEERKLDPNYKPDLDDQDAMLAQHVLDGHHSTVFVKNFYMAFSYCKEMQDNWVRVWESERDPFTRMCKLLLLSTPLDYYAIERLHDHGVDPCLDVLVVRPAIIWETLRTIFLHRGIQTGAVCVRNPTLDMAMDMMSGIVNCKFSHELATALFKPQNVAFAEHTMCLRHIRGMDNTWITSMQMLHKLVRNEEQQGSLLAMLVPKCHDTTRHFFLTPQRTDQMQGFPMTIVSTNEPEEMQVLPTGLEYLGLWGLGEVIEAAFGPNTETSAFIPNTLILPGRQIWPHPHTGTMDQLMPGKSHCKHMAPGYGARLSLVDNLQ